MLSRFPRDKGKVEVSGDKRPVPTISRRRWQKGVVKAPPLPCHIKQNFSGPAGIALEKKAVGGPSVGRVLLRMGGGRRKSSLRRAAISERTKEALLKGNREGLPSKEASNGGRKYCQYSETGNQRERTKGRVQSISRANLLKSRAQQGETSWGDSRLVLLYNLALSVGKRKKRKENSPSRWSIAME